jgi:hypothetical protein
MWMRRLLASAAAAVVATLATGAMTAYAAPTTADLAIAASTAQGHVGQGVDVRYVLRNNGPNAAAPLTYAVDIVAPPGTRIVSTGGGACQVISEGEHVRCRYGQQLAAGDRRQLALRLFVESVPTGCGGMAISYADDPRPSNNVTKVRVTVGGVPRSCLGSTTASPTPTKTKASPSVSPTVDVTETAPDDTISPEDTFAPAAEPQDTVGGGLGFASILVIGGGAVLVSLGGVLIWWMLRRDPDDEADDDATRPIYE